MGTPIIFLEEKGIRTQIPLEFRFINSSCLACARLWNELSYEKRHAFFNRELTPEKYYEINRKYYYKYNETLGVNAQAAIQKND
jgi:hypothetical protein